MELITAYFIEEEVKKGWINPSQIVTILPIPQEVSKNLHHFIRTQDKVYLLAEMSNGQKWYIYQDDLADIADKAFPAPSQPPNTLNAEQAKAEKPTIATFTLTRDVATGLLTLAAESKEGQDVIVNTVRIADSR